MTRAVLKLSSSGNIGSFSASSHKFVEEDDADNVESLTKRLKTRAAA
jgi:hypothetical protein